MDLNGLWVGVGCGEEAGAGVSEVVELLGSSTRGTLPPCLRHTPRGTAATAHRIAGSEAASDVVGPVGVDGAVEDRAPRPAWEAKLGAIFSGSTSMITLPRGAAIRG